jgi:hypothetical protein
VNQILELLREKNSLLEKFYLINKTEIECIADGDFKNIEKFYLDRENILGIIKLIDSKIDDSNKDSESIQNTESISEQHRVEITELLSFKKVVVEKILAQDLGILSQIDDEKSRIIKELASTRTNKKAIGSYKSNSSKVNRLDESF